MEEKKRRGPKPKHTGPVTEFHLKFSGAMAEHIKTVAGNENYQAYFDRLIQQDMQIERTKITADEER